MAQNGAQSSAGVSTGHVIQVAGPAVDIQFAEGEIPVINTAVRITGEASIARLRSTSSSRWPSTSVRAACVPSRSSPPTVWCAA